MFRTVVRLLLGLALGVHGACGSGDSGLGDIPAPRGTATPTATSTAATPAPSLQPTSAPSPTPSPRSTAAPGEFVLASGAASFAAAFGDEDGLLVYGAAIGSDGTHQLVATRFTAAGEVLDSEPLSIAHAGWSPGAAAAGASFVVAWNEYWETQFFSSQITAVRIAAEGVDEGSRTVVAEGKSFGFSRVSVQGPIMAGGARALVLHQSVSGLVYPVRVVLPSATGTEFDENGTSGTFGYPRDIAVDPKGVPSGRVPVAGLVGATGAAGTIVLWIDVEYELFNTAPDLAYLASGPVGGFYWPTGHVEDEPEPIGFERGRPLAAATDGEAFLVVTEGDGGGVAARWLTFERGSLTAGPPVEISARDEGMAVARAVWTGREYVVTWVSLDAGAPVRGVRLEPRSVTPESLPDDLFAGAGLEHELLAGAGRAIVVFADPPGAERADIRARVLALD